MQWRGRDVGSDDTEECREEWEGPKPCILGSRCRYVLGGAEGCEFCEGRSAVGFLSDSSEGEFRSASSWEGASDDTVCMDPGLRAALDQALDGGEEGAVPMRGRRYGREGALSVEEMGVGASSGFVQQPSLPCFKGK